MQLQGSLEENILTTLCWSAEHASALTLELSPDLFSTRPYRRIAEVAFTYISEFARPPAAHLRDILEADLRRGEAGILLNHTLDAMETLFPELHPPYVLAELARFITVRKLALTIENASDALHAGDLEGAERALYQRDVALGSSPGIWLHDAESMLRFLNEVDDDFFPSGIEILDQRRVRPKRKTMFLIIGAKKSGKSWWLVEIGKQSMMHRKTVLHITLENGEEITAKRYVQALFAMTQSKSETIRVPIFKKDSMGRATAFDFDVRTPMHLSLDTRNIVAQRLTALKNRPRLLIKEFPTGSLTIPQLNAYLDTLARQENFKPDMLIIDYPDLMSMRSDNLRIDTSQIFKQLRGIAVARNLAIATVTQANRSGDQSRLVSSSHVAEDFTKTQTADIVCTLSRTSAERQIGLARVLVDAARDTEDKWISMITQNYTTGQFCIDSCYMSKHLSDEVDRFAGDSQDD